MNKKGYFVSSDEEDQQQIQVAQAQARQVILRDPSQELFDQYYQKYINYLKQFGAKTEQIQQKVFGDGIWYVNHPFIQISQINYEKNVGLFDMVNMQAEKYNESQWTKKTLVSFTFVDNQIQKVLSILQKDLYDALLLYGEESNDKKQSQPLQIMTGRMMGIYKKTYDLVRKLMAYIEYLILQLHSMINKKSNYYKPLFKDMHLYSVLDLIGKTLRSVYVIDSIVQNNQSIVNHWQAYKKLVKLAKNQPQKFNTTPQAIKKLQKAMNKYENTILSGNCMTTITEITFDETFQKLNNPLGKIQKNKQLKQFFQKYMNRTLKQLNQNMGTKNDMDQQKRLLQLMCTFTLYKKLYTWQEGKDFWRQLWFMQKKTPIIEVHSFVFIYICIFLQNVCPLQKRPRSLQPKDQKLFISLYVQALQQNISLEIVSQYTKFCVWLSRMQSAATSNSSLKDADKKKQGQSTLKQRISNRISMLCQGFNTILRLKKLLFICFMLHINEQKPISKPLLGKLTLAIQTIKASAYMLRKKAQAFDTMILSKSLARDIQTIFLTWSQKIKSQKNSRQNIHKVTIYNITLQLLDTSLSQLKITWIKHALGYLSQWIIAQGDLKQIKYLLSKLQIILYNRVLVQKYQNLGFLFYARDILPNMFDHKRQNPQTCKRLQFLFQGFQDAGNLLQKCEHLQNKQEIFIEFKKFVVSAFQNNYMIPLKRGLQDFLRVSTSSMLIQKLQGVRPFAGQLSDLMRMVQFEKVRIFDGVVDLKSEISESFNSSFYNLNILNMHDMQTYEMMRMMGNHLFDLKLHDVFLPNHTIERDKFDILAVVRNIPTFVNSYKYNILSQRFLQITAQNKIISCISIQQLSDSIKTHGLGILSTTVNAFYKFLITKITAFNKFLFMEDIQNITNRDKKWFKQFSAKPQYNGFYPYERAQVVYNQIKKLGKFQQDTNYLDKFRQIITAVGNSLGFIRLIRSASLHTQSKYIQYLPNKHDIAETFEQIANKSTLGDISKTACKQLDDILKSLDERFGQKIDYLNLMIKAFSKMVTKQNKHLKQFYLLIPALSLNYIQFVVRGKQLVNKKLATKAFIYDDGFVLGLSYFLTLLKQYDHFKILHWRQATQAYFEQSKKQSKNVSSVDPTNHSAKFIEQLNMQKQLLMKKLLNMQEQFLFFDYNMDSAKILFKSGSSEQKDLPKSPPSASQISN